MNKMTPLERVLTALSHKEPDRVPLFLLLTLHGAKELGLTIKEYFSKSENVVEGQLRLQKKYENDCLYPFFYAPVEIEACGGEVIFSDDGPPNSGTPIIKKQENILNLKYPKVSESPCLLKILRTIEILKQKKGNEIPIIGIIMSPFSLPVMQMGFDNYIELIYERPDLFEHLMRLNMEFSVEWANAQIDAGATAIGYFDPVSSPSIIPRDIYLRTGFEVARKTLGRIKGPVAIHFGSAICHSIIDDIIKLSPIAIGVSVKEDLSAIKTVCSGKLSIMGNLNAIEMCRWTAQHAEEMVKEVIYKAGQGGGFILSDNHGEIPFQVSDDILLSISEAVRKWGKYPIEKK